MVDMVLNIALPAITLIGVLLAFMLVRGAHRRALILGLGLTLIVISSVGAQWISSSGLFSRHNSTTKESDLAAPDPKEKERIAKTKLLEIARSVIPQDASKILTEAPDLAHDAEVMQEVLPQQVLAGNKDFLEVALKENPSLASQSYATGESDDSPLLHLATRSGNVDVVKLVLERFPDTATGLAAC